MMATAAVPAATCWTSWTVRAGSTGQPALCVEQRLTQLGYLAGTPDSTFDAIAVNALRSYEGANGLAQDGVADRATLTHLGIYRPPPATPAPTCHVWYYVRRGSTGRPAECVERRLVQLGYSLAGPDASFDGSAVNALRKYQFDQGLAITGIADGTTLARMRIWTSRPTTPTPTCHVWFYVRQGTTGRPAECVERRLAQLGYSLTGPDFDFDASAVRALRSYQYFEGLPVTGVADGTTLSRMRIWTAAPVLPRPTCYVTLAVQRNTRGQPAKCVEQRLAQLGYTLTGPDYTFDGSAANALRKYQFHEGLPITGRADQITLSRLRVWRTPSPLPAPMCRVHHTIRTGSIGPEARCVESRLLQLGYAVSKVDTTFDRASATALGKFQFWNGLASSGVADRATLERLGIYTSTPPSPPPTQLPASSGTGRRVVYSRAQQRIWVVEANGTVSKTHRVSGRTWEPSAGTYQVYSRSLYTYSAKDPSVRWRYMVRFTYGFQGGRIGFHEIPNRNGVPLQSREQLGLPLSSGCVRQSTPDAQWLWNWAYIGTKVVVL
jgi:peptidoglycan hydrolase-like protein with peptidoglycan-binding domain